MTFLIFLLLKQTAEGRRKLKKLPTNGIPPDNIRMELLSVEHWVDPHGNFI